MTRLRRRPRLAANATLALALVVSVGDAAFGQAATRPTTDQVEAEANEAGATLNRRLDQPLDLDVQDRPLPEVLNTIAERAGVEFVVPERTYALLPYGRQTPISANAKKTPLRLTLELITVRLGLSFEQRDGVIEVRPMPALQRSGRRATVGEIAALDLLANVPLDTLESEQTAAKLLSAVDLRLEQIDAEARADDRPVPGYRVDNRLTGPAADAPVRVPRRATLLTALQAVAEQTNATWYPDGDRLVVLPKADWVRSRLDATRVTIGPDGEGEGVPVQEALRQIGRAAGVAVEIEAGAVARLPESARRVRLDLTDVTAREALSELGAVTGLGHVVGPSGVYVWDTSPLDPDAPTLANGVEAGRPLVMVDLGGGASMPLYASDLSDEARARLEGRRREAAESVAQTLRSATRPADGGEPSTRPAEVQDDAPTTRPDPEGARGPAPAAPPTPRVG